MRDTTAGYMSERQLARRLLAGYDTAGFREDSSCILRRTPDGARGDALGAALVGICGGIAQALAAFEGMQEGGADPMASLAAWLRLPFNRACYLAMRHRPDRGWTIPLIAHLLSRDEFFKHVPSCPH